MKKSKLNKVIYFSLGLLFGVSLGYISALYFLGNHETEIVVVEKEVKSPETIVKIKKPKAKKKNKKDKITADTTVIAIQDSSLNNDTVQIKEDFSDSLLIISITEDDLEEELYNQAIDNEEFEVAYDELLDVRYIKPTGNEEDFECDSNNELDSLLINNYEITEDDKFRVEFWKSPVNFTGYKLSRKKLVLFGVLNINSVELEYSGTGKILLKYNDSTYSLRCSDEYVSIVISKDK